MGTYNSKDGTEDHSLTGADSIPSRTAPQGPRNFVSPPRSNPIAVYICRDAPLSYCIYSYIVFCGALCRPCPRGEGRGRRSMALRWMAAPRPTTTRVRRRCLLYPLSYSILYLYRDMCCVLTVVPTVFRWEHGGRAAYITGTFNNWEKQIPMHKSGNDFTYIHNLKKAC